MTVLAGLARFGGSVIALTIAPATAFPAHIGSLVIQYERETP
jgi:hypothetical protein